MNTVTQAQLEQVEKEITQKMLDKRMLSSKLLFYDLTNFFTHISTTNKHAELAQRGKNKQKRDDLRQFGLKLSDVRKAELITITGLKDKPEKETLLEKMEPELEKLYETMAQGIY